MELNREQVVKALEKWMKNYDGKVTNFSTLGNAIGLIEKLDDENKRLQDLIQEVQQYNEAWVEDNGKLRKEMKVIKADTVGTMKDKLTAMSEFYLHADRDGGLHYVDFCDWIDQVVKEILGEK